MDLSKLRYTPTHEWVSLNGNVATVGITDHAQKEISDVVFVELPQAERQLKQKESAMVIESVKAAFDIYAPISGKVTKVNDKLKDKPETVNRAPYGEGWLFEMTVNDPKDFEKLLTKDQYDSTKDAAHH